MINRGSSGKVSAADLIDANGAFSAHWAGFRMRCMTAIRGMLVAAAMLPLLAFPQKATASDADNFPSKPIRLVVPYGAGGIQDTIGRLVATAMTKELGKTVYVENRGGAGGTVGAAAVAKSPPDGYTIMTMSLPNVAVAPVMLPNLPYDALEDFTPIATVVTTPSLLVISPSLPVKTMADLVAYGKVRGKDKLSFASGGPGSTGQILGHILETLMGTTMVNISYKATALSFPDVIAGRVSMAFDFVPSVLGYIRTGDLRPIAMMAESRSSLLPDVPTAAEAGFPAATMVSWWIGIEGPPKMPPAIVEKLNAAINASVASQAMRDQLAKLGAAPFVTSPMEFNTLLHRDTASLRQFVKEMGLRPE